MTTVSMDRSPYGGSGFPRFPRQAQPGRIDFGAPGLAIPAPQPEPPQAPELPKAPPRNTNPWAKENRSRTLLDIGSAFLSHDNFFEGLGAAAKGLGERQDELKAGPKVDYGGPDNRFEISTDPHTGERTIREVPEFAKVLDAKQAAKDRPSPPSAKDQVELRARLIRTIGQLPAEQRPGAYAAVMNNPGQYGLDVTGMPPGWDDQYAAVMGSLGQTVNQAEQAEYRGQVFQHRQTVDNRRLGQTDARITAAAAKKSLPKAPPRGRGGSGKANVPAGFTLD